MSEQKSEAPERIRLAYNPLFGFVVSSPSGWNPTPAFSWVEYVRALSDDQISTVARQAAEAS